LKEEKKLRRHHLELLITEQLNFLDLSHEIEDVAHPIRLASIRSPVKNVLINKHENVFDIFMISISLYS